MKLAVLFGFALGCFYGIAQENNILLIIADDIGVDPVNGFMPEALEKANTPVIDSLRLSGLTFANAWSSPTCSPTRASILTGKHGFRTGVLNPDVDGTIDPTEYILHQHITQESNSEMSSCIIGKWHLGGNANSDIPLIMGVPHYAGLMSGGVASYDNWTFTDNGIASLSNEYATTKLTNEAISWINDQENPWFCWLAYNTPHTPFHLPPDELHSYNDLEDSADAIEANPLPYYLAMIESMDSEIGRLLSEIPNDELENTTIIFIGDNGTSGGVVQDPYTNNRAKGSLFQGGINVPFIASGNQVTRVNEVDSSLISVVDLFCTVTELAGFELNTYEDSFSFFELLSEEGTGQRECVFSDAKLETRGYGWAARNDRYKYIVWDSVPERFYDLQVDPFETQSLLTGMGNLNDQEQLAFNKLSQMREVLSLDEVAVPELVLFPNPVADKFSIYGVFSYTRIEILDETGRLVNRLEYAEDIDVSELKPGMYLVRIDDQIIRIIKTP